MRIKQKAENGTTESTSSYNVISAGTTVKGDVFSDTDFRLDGKIEGDVTCNGKLVIGPKGAVKGKIIAKNAEISGNVEGSLSISGALALKATSTVKGEISTQSLEIEANAKLDGTCSMRQASQAGTTPSASSDTEKK
ncbi:polymer-forming cytoskeletal protein [Parabacteroides sp. OttesenSCG-928-G07]|nr:polymer-forming cytoskeletal protein [Parabacteroides sp. OttesenSCG-928-G21]MDL2277566.1 polymer-forming cytoskeletal protein [Parabacteroides sp. OttesenSCG-928-G07]